MEEVMLTVDWNLLSDVSYRTNLGKSLKNTLRKFDKDALFGELNDMIDYFSSIIEEIPINAEKRIKSIHSCQLKYEKYFPNVQVEKAFNDILGIRVIVDDYSVFDAIELPDGVKIADMRNGKARDDGYRGIHLYFQKDHFHYPIEVQFMTPFDRQFNEWLHIYLYKYVKDLGVGIKLRKMYENGELINETDFRKEMKELCAI